MEEKVITTMSAELIYMTWEQYLNLLMRREVGQVIEQVDVSVPTNVFTGYENPNVRAENYEPVEDASYKRVGIKLEKMTNPAQTMREQLISQLKDVGVEFKDYSNGLQEAAEEASVESLMNFGEPTCLVDLGNEEFLVAPRTSEDVVIRMISPTQGALVIYRPRMFTLIRMVEKAKAV